MIQTKELENGKVEVTSSTGYVNIGEGAVKKIICEKEEVEYIEEVKPEEL